MNRNGGDTTIGMSEMLCEPRWRTSRNPRRSNIATTSRGLRIGGFGTDQATTV
jgi:hypothetical protein